MLASAIAILLLIAPPPAAGEAVRDQGAERLEYMKESVTSFRFVAAGDPKESPRLQPEPAFRLGKQPADNLEDGAIFFWRSPEGRPEAAVQIFLISVPGRSQGLWINEFTSLASAPIALERGGRPYWSPATPGVQFRPVPGAPTPGAAASQRTRQMSELAKGFRASDDFKGNGRSALRLLPKPISRYGKAGGKVEDGALFAFVLGTDTEVFLFLEARPAKDGLEWQYALAPMTVYAVRATYQGKEVWALPDRNPAYDPSKPFFDKQHEP
jgi:hypothetical protein